MKAITISPARWIRPGPVGPLVKACRLSGLSPTRSWYGDTEGRPWIDASIARLVAALNFKGYRTFFACSGLRCDHQKPATGHLIFAPGINLKRLGVPQAFRVEHCYIAARGGARRHTVLQFVKGLTEAQKVTAWADLLRRVEEAG